MRYIYVTVLSLPLLKKPTVMTSKSASLVLRSALRDKINERLEHLALKREDAALLLGLAPAQVSRLRASRDVFTLDRLVDVAAALGITVRMQATRPYKTQ